MLYPSAAATKSQVTSFSPEQKKRDVRPRSPGYPQGQSNTVYLSSPIFLWSDGLAKTREEHAHVAPDSVIGFVACGLCRPC